MKKEDKAALFLGSFISVLLYGYFLFYHFLGDPAKMCGDTKGVVLFFLVLFTILASVGLIISFICCGFAIAIWFSEDKRLKDASFGYGLCFFFYGVLIFIGSVLVLFTLSWI